MKLTIEHIKDGRQQEVDSETWSKMGSRGDARKWRVVKRSVEPPAEIKEAFDEMTKRRRTKPAEVEDVAPVDENEEN